MTFQTSRLKNWLEAFYGGKNFKIHFLAGDASLRRYYRIQKDNQSYVLMDSSSEKEKLTNFINVGNIFRKNQVITPKVLHLDQKEGLCLLSDFGDRLLYDLFKHENNDYYYGCCLDELIKINQIGLSLIPEYTYEKFIEELRRMNEWFFEWIKLTPNSSDKLMLSDLFEKLAEISKEQPQTTLHRDYHSKNIMLLNDQTIGVLDYQDAVFGPVVYDLVSLLRDCYIAWPEQIIEKWMDVYFNLLKSKNIIPQSIDFITFKRWFDWVGMQRHIKCLGIFSCLYVRDGRPIYLKHIPRVIEYISNVSKEYEELKPWLKFLCDKIKPHFDKIDIDKLMLKEAAG